MARRKKDITTLENVQMQAIKLVPGRFDGGKEQTEML